LVLNVTSPNLSGVSPLLVEFDATGTTDSATLGGGNNTFQDVYYTWNFGDSGTSGSGTWAYGSRPGVNSMNAATGAVSAHLFVCPLGSGPCTYTVTAHATDGTNTASPVATTVTVSDAASVFAGTATTCISSSGTPVAGSGGCPAGAAVKSYVIGTDTLNSVLGVTQTNHRFLFKCGNSGFSGNNVSINSHTTVIGAYGSPDCSGTTTNRPVFTNSGTSGLFSIITNTSGSPTHDIRIMDIDYEAGGTGGAFIGDFASGSNNPISTPYQILVYNVLSNQSAGLASFTLWAQTGFVSNDYEGVAGGSSIGIFAGGHFCATGVSTPGSQALWCGAGSYSASNYYPTNYNVLLGNMVNNHTPAGGAGVETVRVAACRLCVLSNNSIENANNVGANLKFHGVNNYFLAGNSPQELTTWLGEYSEYNEISYNYIGGTSSYVMELTTQAADHDERLRFNRVYGNVFSLSPVTGNFGSIMLFLDGINETVADNAFYEPAGVPGSGLGSCILAGRRLTTVPTGWPAYLPQQDEVYNNTCSIQIATGSSAQAAILMKQGVGGTSGPQMTNSWINNNLFSAVSTAGGTATVIDTLGGNTACTGASGNCTGYNSPTPTASPGFSNGSGTFSLISDYQPSANYSGATSVPNLYDALNQPWLGSWNLGAVIF
jgi:hypothetical protein